jgi:hypothetical protein
LTSKPVIIERQYHTSFSPFLFLMDLLYMFLLLCP